MNVHSEGNCNRQRILFGYFHKSRRLDIFQKIYKCVIRNGIGNLSKKLQEKLLEMFGFNLFCLIKYIQVSIFKTIKTLQMSFNTTHLVQELVPSYSVRSEYLPTNTVIVGNQGQTSQWLRRYEESKRQGRVFTQRPVEFNPNRYVSVQTYENVRVNQPISEVQFQSEISRFRRY